MARQSAPSRGALRAFVETFPPLKLALKINDSICFIFQSILDVIGLILKFVYRRVFRLVSKCFSWLSSLSPHFLRSKASKGLRYERIRRAKLNRNEPVPYRNDSLKRALTYQIAIVLGAALYIFVYFVLVKHHSHITIAVALILMLAFMIVLENSHNIRSIVMLSLPIMFTNRGRALVFCCMLALMVTGPMANSRANIHELHNSLNCSKSYLILKADEEIQTDVVDRLVKFEVMIRKVTRSLEQFAVEVREKFLFVKDLLITVQRYLSIAYEEFKKIVDICNSHSQDVHTNCINTFKFAYEDCKYRLGSTFDFLCEIVAPLDGLCVIVQMPDKICRIPRSIGLIAENIYREDIEPFLNIIQNELRVSIEPHYNLSLELETSKKFSVALQEVRYDIEQKFWYVQVIGRLFNLVSLILVIWILTTATLYHMHYLDEIGYDNMYIDDRIVKIDESRKNSLSRVEADNKLIDKSDDSKVQFESEKAIKATSPHELEDEKSQELTPGHLFPMSKTQERQYLRPLSLRMNDAEIHKLYLAGLIWIAIVGYIFLFVLLDYALYNLMVLLYEMLKKIVFDSNLPIIEVTSKKNQNVTYYDRAMLRQLSLERRKELTNNYNSSTGRGGVIDGLYRRLMNSVEKDIPDDIDILDSLEGCLPKPSVPNYHQYKVLLGLAAFTFMAVVVEAYALRTRHWIANLYYPIRAKKRAIWLYKKMMSEKPKFVDVEFDKGAEPKEATKDTQIACWETAFKILAGRVRR